MGFGIDKNTTLSGVYVYDLEYDESARLDESLRECYQKRTNSHTRPFEVRDALLNDGLEVHEGTDCQDSSLLPNYNLAPGNRGLVYLAQNWQRCSHESSDQREIKSVLKRDNSENTCGCEVKFTLKIMKWGLIPFWAKQMPNYGSLLKTINCRDDSLKQNKPTWNRIKNTNRCVAIAQGFYEWLKKSEKRPYFVRRKDGKFLCLAGLYDCVQFEGTKEKNHTYTIITTNSNKQLEFLHDRMPVILENGSDELRKWLDPNQSIWSNELQALLKPFDGELEVYPVTKDVGKLVNNSSRLIIPVASSENKSNIAHFFSKNAPKDTLESISSKQQCKASQTLSELTNVKQEDGEGERSLITEKNIRASYCEISQGTHELAKKRKLTKIHHEDRGKFDRKTQCISITKSSFSCSKPESPTHQNLTKFSRYPDKGENNLKITSFFKN